MGYRNTPIATYDKPLLGFFKLYTLLLAAVSTHLKEKETSLLLPRASLTVLPQWNDIPYFYGDYPVQGIRTESLPSAHVTSQ